MSGYFPGGGGGWVVKSNNSANSAQLSYANQLDLSLAIQWVSFPSNNRTSAVKTQDGLKSILPSVPSKCSHRDTRHWRGFRTASQ